METARKLQPTATSVDQAAGTDACEGIVNLVDNEKGDAANGASLLPGNSDRGDKAAEKLPFAAPSAND